MNWKKILALIIAFGAVSEFMSVITDYNSGKLQSWPFGVEIGLILIMILAITLWRSGTKKSTT